LIITAVVLAALALTVAVGTLIYVHLNTPISLVPGAFQNATVVVSAKGQIVSVAQSSSPTIVLMSPERQQGPSSDVSQTTLPANASSDTTKKPFPWSPKPPLTSSPSSSSEGVAPPSPTEIAASKLPPPSSLSPESRMPPAETEPSNVPKSEPSKVVEKFVKFQSVKFKTGNIDTGWRYADSNATEPEAQWCYYKNLNVRSKGLQPTIDLEDEADLEAIQSVGLTYDEYVEARNKCQWFNNTKPLSTPSVKID
jgi:hypothetical protein